MIITIGYLLILISHANSAWCQEAQTIDRLGPTEWARQKMPVPVSPSAAALRAVDIAIDRAKMAQDQRNLELARYQDLDRKYKKLDETTRFWEIKKLFKVSELGKARQAQAGKLGKAVNDMNHRYQEAIDEASQAFGITIAINAEKLRGDTPMRPVVDWNPRYSECEKMDPFGKCRRIRIDEAIAANVKIYGHTDYARNGRVVLFGNAFENPQTLGSILYHEMFHWIHHVARGGAEPWPAEDFKSEQVAYELQAQTSATFGKSASRSNWKNLARVNEMRYEATRAKNGAPAKTWEWVRRTTPIGFRSATRRKC